LSDVARAVVDEEHLDAIGILRGEVVDRLKGGGQLIRRIVHGDHERQGGYVRRRTEHLCLVTMETGRVSRWGTTIRAGAAYSGGARSAAWSLEGALEIERTRADSPKRNRTGEYLCVRDDL